MTDSLMMVWMTRRLDRDLPRMMVAQKMTERTKILAAWVFDPRGLIGMLHREKERVS